MPDLVASRLGENPDSHSSPHALTFRVMRLTTPLPSKTNAPALIGNDLSLNDSSRSEVKLPISPPWQAEGARCGVGLLTTLPNSFGAIYASETFRSFISVFNRSTEPVHNVSISVHIQTPSSQRISLLQSQGTVRRSLPTRASINNVVSVPLPEVGNHVLVCTASYEDSTVEEQSTRTLRQFFRFNVLPTVDASYSVLPLYPNLQPFNATKTLPHSTKNSNHLLIASHFLAHIRVHNAIPNSIFLTNANFSPSVPYHVRHLRTDDDKIRQNGLQSFAKPAEMGAGDTQNLLFLLFSYAADSRLYHRQQNSKENGEVTQRKVGEVTIRWRSAVGEYGEIRSDVNGSQSTITCEAVSVCIYAVPHQVEAHKPFVARCAARNNCTRPTRMYLQIRRDLVSEIVPVGVSGVSLGEVQALETCYCALTLIGLVRGQHNICGIRVVDMDSNASYKAEAPVITVN